MHLLFSYLPHSARHFWNDQQAHFISLKDFPLKVPGSSRGLFKGANFAFFSEKVPGSTKSAWEPGSQVPHFNDIWPPPPLPLWHPSHYGCLKSFSLLLPPPILSPLLCCLEIMMALTLPKCPIRYLLSVMKCRLLQYSSWYPLACCSYYIRQQMPGNVYYWSYEVIPSAQYVLSFIMCTW